MTCQPTPTHSELEFVRALLHRDARLGECVGPIVFLPIRTPGVIALENVLDSEAASDLLYSGQHSIDGSIITFGLCAGHWLELATIIEVRSAQYRRDDWAFMGRSLAYTACETAGWDPKEIVNMFSWQTMRG